MPDIVKTLRTISDEALAGLDEAHAALFGRWQALDQEAQGLAKQLADTQASVTKNLEMTAEVEALMKKFWPSPTPHDVWLMEVKGIIPEKFRN
jgi:hypothetical protein